VTTTLTDVPDVAEGVKTQPTAEPAFVKSAAAIPETDSPNATPKVNDIADAGDEGVDENEAVGRSTSMLIVGAAVSPPGPFCREEVPATAFCNIVTITDPVVGADDDSDNEYVVPLPVNPTIDQPLLVPETVKSDVSRPVTSSEKTTSYVSDDTFVGLATVAAKVVGAGASSVISTIPCPLRAPEVIDDVNAPAAYEPPPPPPERTSAP
jgi:hypothetical protein